ncbi:MAG: M42 family metallopeptidase [Bacillota bacterium]|nr:M42 family metallopeptidase [Bacillota bacterium]
MKTLEFARELLAIPSPSGYTKNIMKFLGEECGKRDLKYHFSPKGNLSIDFAGKNDHTVGLCAHVDTLGAMIKSINSDGTLKFTVIGGPLLPTYDGEYCYVLTRGGKTYTGTFLSNSPSIHVYRNATTLERKEDNMHVRLDEKVKSKDDVLKLGIAPGDFISVEPKTVITESGFIKSRFLDDKISVAILFSVIDEIIEKRLELKYNVKIIITAYEEVGHGASAIPEVDELIAVDMGCVGDDLSCTEYDVSICAKDSFSPYDFDMTNNLVKKAQELQLNYALDIYPYYGSDVSAALRSGNNIRGALIGPGVSASHGMERTHLDAVNNTIRLIIGYLT